MITAIIITLISLYAAVCLGMFVLQEKLVFPKHLVTYERLNRVFSREEFEKYEIETEPGIVLRGISSRSPKKNAPLIFALSGNRYDVIRFVRFMRDIYGPDYHVVGVNYRGYGLPSYRSDSGPTQDGILKDVLVSYDKIVEEFEPSEVYAVGFSLGSSVGSYLMRERDVKGLVAITPFDSIRRVAQSKHPYLPIPFILKHPFPTREFITDNPKPVSIVAAGADEVMPAKHLERLKKFIPNLRYDVTVPGMTHSGLLEHPDFPDHMRKALTALVDKRKTDNVVNLATEAK